jgi:peptidoglycan LD-endopeptidase LytH
MKIILSAAVILLAVSCRTSSRPGLFAKKTPHEQYGKQITDAGLQSTVLGKSWFAAADSAVVRPVNIKHPYRETGFFAADRPAATGLRFSAVRGEKLQISLSRKPSAGFKLYADLWQQDSGVTSSGARTATLKLIASSDTSGVAIEHEVDKSGFFILRIQPELLRDCEYTISIGAVASLAYPIRAPGKNHTKSFWGADRDAGGRRHEGVDMFAARGTPVVAAAEGRVTRVNQNNLGGKVVWMRPKGKDYTLYYAHLDSQLVQDGQAVQIGDTLGLMGNTGNARSTPPHLHFGIYTMGGAIDPFPFINPRYPEPEPINADTRAIGGTRRLTAATSLLTALPVKMALTSPLAKNDLVRVTAATGDWYRIQLPDGKTGFVPSRLVGQLTPAQLVELKTGTYLLSEPDSLAPAKKLLAAGTRINQLASFNQYLYVRTADQLEGWIEKQGHL